VQPTSTTSLVIGSADFSFEGTVDDPPVPYKKESGLLGGRRANGKTACRAPFAGGPRASTGFRNGRGERSEDGCLPPLRLHPDRRIVDEELSKVREIRASCCRRW